jgi:hypothetical protein
MHKVTNLTKQAHSVRRASFHSARTATRAILQFNEQSFQRHAHTLHLQTVHWAEIQNRNY